MDTKKVLNLLGLAERSKNISKGSDTVLNNVKTNKCYLVLIANDASVNTQKKFIDKCKFYNVNYTLAFSSLDLSNAIGKDAVKVLSINDLGFSKNILNLLKESTDYES